MAKRMRSRHVAALRAGAIGRGAVWLACSWAMGQEAYPSFQGYSGLLNVPDAYTAPDGTFTYLRGQHSDQRWPGGGTPEDYHVMVGFLPYVEGGMRLAVGGGRYLMDLSSHMKVRVPGVPLSFPQVAIGIQDLGSAAAHFRTRYVVASHLLGPLTISLGHGRGPDRLKGTFGGLELRLAPWLSVMAEDDTRDRSVGIRLATPHGWLPWNAQVMVLAAHNFRASQDPFSIGGMLRVPLDLGHARRGRAEARSSQAWLSPPAAPLPPPNPEGANISNPETIPALKESGQAKNHTEGTLQAQLVEMGFENVRVGQRDRVLIVELENNLLNHNAMDGMGVALGIATRSAGETVRGVELILLRRGLRILRVEAPLEPLRAFFLGRMDGYGLAESRLKNQIRVRQAEGEGGLEKVVWQGAPANRTWGHTALVVQPGLLKTIGTEVGRMDYQALLRIGSLTNLWPGGLLECGAVIPVSHSREFGPGGLFRPEAVPRSRVERVVIAQAMPLLPGLFAQVTAGRAFHQENGRTGELHWRSGDGNHRLSLIAGDYSHMDQPPAPWPRWPDRHVRLFSYRVAVPILDASAEVTYGSFLNQDKGYHLELRRWFRDASVRVHFSKTSAKVLGLSFGIPLTPRKDMRPGWVQVRGTAQYVEGLRSVVQNPDGRNPVRFGLAEVPTCMASPSSNMYDFDRLGVSGVLRGMARWREAYERFFVIGNAPALQGPER